MNRSLRPFLVSVATLATASAATAQLSMQRRMLPSTLGEVESVNVADFDGDGDLDVLLGGAGKRLQTLELLKNDGHALFSPPTFSGLGDFPGDAMVGDLDGDGDPDVAGRMAFALNDGTGNFTSKLYPTRMQGFRMDLADMDGDGDLDVIQAGEPDDDIILVNDGSASFQPLHLPPKGLNAGTYDIAAGDYDGDGDLDVIAMNAAPHPVRLYRNEGNLVFTDQSAGVQPMNFSGYQLELGDVDGDGNLDIVLGHDAVEIILLGDGAGGFSAGATLPSLPNWYVTDSLHLIDLDSDGDLDLFRAHQCISNSCGRAQILENDGIGNFVDSGLALARSVRGAAFGDLDGDGDLDMVLGVGRQDSDGKDRLMLGDGTLAFTDVTEFDWGALSERISSIALGDVDGDGVEDALFGSTPPALLHGRGNGTFEITSGRLPGGMVDGAVALFDVDGDGDLDAFVASMPNRMLLNDGTGTFTDALGSPLVGTLAGNAVDLGDIDGDGDVDIAVATDKNDKWLENVGGGTLVVHSLLETSIFIEEVALVDADVDGDLDALVGSRTALAYLRNDGGKFVVDNSVIPEGKAVGSQAISVADLDGDGDSDVLFQYFESLHVSYFEVWRNQGGTFQIVRPMPPGTGIDTKDIAVFDYDGDGDLDAYLGGTSDNDRLLLNDGTGVLRDVTSTLQQPLPYSRVVTTADLDLDGDRDFLLASDSHPIGAESGGGVLLGLSRHLAWRAVPRIGQPLPFEVHGPAHGFWALAVAASPVQVSIGRLGTLRLDPTTLGMAGMGLLDGTGTGTVTFPAPAVPATVGFTSYLQAAVGPNLRLTNLEIATVSGL